MHGSDDKLTLRITASRLEKGLLAIPRRFGAIFPTEKCEIMVVFDDGNKPQTKSFLPFDVRTKECRIFGLARWFAKRNVAAGDLITISVEDSSRLKFRISLDRHLNERRQKATRKNLYSAGSDKEAKEQLVVLSDLRKKERKQTARDELLLLSQKTPSQRGKRIRKQRAQPNEGVTAAIRILLAELHEGRCQVCSFAFRKVDGDPYFEIHHIDPDLGHHPMNLLVVCANCHAQFEHASVTALERSGGWLVAVTINGKRFQVRQPLLEKPPMGSALRILALLFALHATQLPYFS